MKIKNYVVTGLGLVMLSVAIFIYSCKRELSNVKYEQKDFDYFKSNMASDPDIVSVSQNNLAYTNFILTATKRRLIIRMQGGKIPDSLKRVSKATPDEIKELVFAAKTREDLEKIIRLDGYEKDAHAMAGNLIAMNAALQKFVVKNKEFKRLPPEQQQYLLKTALRALLAQSQKNKTFSLFKKVQESGDNGMDCLDAFNTAAQIAAVAQSDAVLACLLGGLTCEAACALAPPPTEPACVALCFVAEAACEYVAGVEYNHALDFAEIAFDQCVYKHEHQNTSLRKDIVL